MQSSGHIEISTIAGTASVDPTIGQIAGLRLAWDGRVLEPLHFAPWRNDGVTEADASITPVERRLGGDFFCAPFGLSDVEPAPAHGWSANSAWTPLDVDNDTVRLALDRKVMGARIEKTVMLAPDSPVLLQEHIISGGEGQLTFAHHPMVHFQRSARLAVSPKARVMTEGTPLDPGRNRIAAGVDVRELASVPTADGGAIDPCELPIGDQHEDFVIMVEAAGNPLGWSAVLREAEDDIVFVLKDPGVMPVTMFWHSNGGRDGPPWNGSHRNVVGIEDGCAAGAGGHGAALRANPLSSGGTPTALTLAAGTRHVVRHAIGAVPRPAGWRDLAHIALEDGALVFVERGGETLTLPFRSDFFKGEL